MEASVPDPSKINGSVLIMKVERWSPRETDKEGIAWGPRPGEGCRTLQGLPGFQAGGNMMYVHFAGNRLQVGCRKGGSREHSRRR